MYKKETYGVTQGYAVTWQELKKAISEVFPDGLNSDGTYQKIRENLWNKDNMSRTYLNVVYYRNHKQESQMSLGYYDNVNSRYIVTDVSGIKVFDVIASIQK